MSNNSNSKKLIGLPGESIKVEDGKIFINGKALDESEYLEDIDTVGSVEIKLAEDEYFVLGDNRQASSDSRKWGEVDKKFIIGRAWLRAWPFSRAGILNN